MNGTRHTEDDQSGIALVVVIVMSGLATIMTMGLFYASNTQISLSKKDVAFEQAFFLADAGIERAKAMLKTNGIARELKGPDNILGTADDGTPSFGAIATNTTGSYSVRLRDDSTNLYVDANNTVIVLSTGTVNSITRVIEASVYIPPATQPFLPAGADAALAFYGTNSGLGLGGSALVDGRDWDVPATFGQNGSFNAWSSLSGGAPCESSVYSSTNFGSLDYKSKEVFGSASPPPFQFVYGNGNYTAAAWSNVANQLAALATTIITNNPGTNPDIGTRDNPVIILVQSNGTLNIGNNGQGAGALIINAGGHVNLGGNYTYEGLIITMGNSANNAINQIMGQGTPTILGAVVCLGVGASVAGQGNPTIAYSSAALANLSKLQPATTAKVATLYWHEIK